MKWLVYLFSLYILLLSGTPCDADDDCCSNPMEQRDHKPVSPCSPFFACGAIHAVEVPEAYTVKPTPIRPVAKLHAAYIPPQLSDFFPSIWQPPKQV
jgi:hypothetical protein